MIQTTEHQADRDRKRAENERKRIENEKKRAFELFEAAKRYCAVADWFERRKFSDEVTAEDERAGAMLNHAEADLRRAGFGAIGNSHPVRKELIEEVARAVGETQ